MAAAEFASLSWRRSGRSQRRDGSIFRRALGSGELQFYWDTVFNGTSITIGHLVLEAEPEYEKQIFCKENIEMAWSRMKQRFPLLAASVEELSDSRTVEFVLDETSLRTIRRDEISFLEDLGSAEDAARSIDRLQNGPPVLTNEIIAKLMVGPQKDTPRIYHVVIVIAHYITDGVTGMTLKREFCQELTELSREGHILAEPLEKRLAAFTPIETLGPHRGRSLSRRRWRSAAAKVIYQIRQARLKVFRNATDPFHTLIYISSSGWTYSANYSTHRSRGASSVPHTNGSPACSSDETNPRQVPRATHYFRKRASSTQSNSFRAPSLQTSSRKLPHFRNRRC